MRFDDDRLVPNAGSNRRINPDATPTSRIIHRLLVVEEVVERREGARRMARMLDDKVRRKQAAMYWTRACCKQKTAMGVVDESVMNTVSQVTAFVYAKVFATMLSSISTNCYVSATRQRLKLEGSRILEFAL
jgi:hypothetical protein